MEIISFDQPSIIAGFRPVEDADANALFSSELAALGRAVPKVRRQSGAARIVARTLLGKLGFRPIPILKTQAGAPTWPAAIVGSLAHHDTAAAAAVAQTKAIAALGIDIEPNEPLPKNLMELIATPREQHMYDVRLLQRRDLFVLKEAVYKAYSPLFSDFLEFHDVEVDIRSRSAHVRKTNCTFSIELLISENVIGLAYLRAPAPNLIQTV